MNFNRNIPTHEDDTTTKLSFRIIHVSSNIFFLLFTYAYKHR